MKEKLEEEIKILNEILLELESLEKELKHDNEIIELEDKGRKFSFNYNEIQNSELKKINIKDIKNKINKIIKRNEEITNNFEKNIKKYNEQYINYLTSEIDNIISFYREYLKEKEGFLNKNGFISIKTNFFTGINGRINISLIELYEYFKYGNKNYIIFGKNGAGKTTLLHKIRESFLNQNSFAIPAYRSLKCNSNNVYQNERTLLDLNSILVNEKAIDILIVKLIKQEQEELKRAHESKEIRTENTIIEEFYRIFSELGLERKVKINIDKEEILLYDDDIAEYSLSLASDGEKIIVYTIMSILLVPLNAYVFIDEPENHLNGTLMIELFNKLEEIRSDLKFIYLTHNIDFIESRTNIELIYLEKTKKINTWKFKEIDNFDEIDLDIILSIEGAKKDIIFCEGDNNNSIDYKIYSNIYKGFLIMPVSSCEKVIENVKVINSNSQIRRTAYGILDNDFKNNEEIKELDKENIFVLDKSEIENILLDEEIIIKVNELNTNESDISNIKRHVIDFAKKHKDIILKDFLNKKYNRIIKTNNIRYSNQLEKEIDENNEKNKKEIIEEINELSINIDKYIESENYEKVITILPGKTVIKSIVKMLGFSEEKAFIAFIANQIKMNSEFKQLITSKLPIINIKS